MVIENTVSVKNKILQDILSFGTVKKWMYKCNMKIMYMK